MNEELEKEFAKLSEKDKREVNNLIRFMQEKKYHDKQYEKLLNQYIELSRDYDYLQSKIDKANKILDKHFQDDEGIVYKITGEYVAERNEKFIEELRDILKENRI